MYLDFKIQSIENYFFTPNVTFLSSISSVNMAVFVFLFVLGIGCRLW